MVDLPVQKLTLPESMHGTFDFRSPSRPSHSHIGMVDDRHTILSHRGEVHLRCSSFIVPLPRSSSAVPGWTIDLRGTSNTDRASARPRCVLFQATSILLFIYDVLGHRQSHAHTCTESFQTYPMPSSTSVLYCSTPGPELCAQTLKLTLPALLHLHRL